MNSKTKQKVVIFLGLAVLLTALFASSLSQGTFLPGMPLPAFDTGHLIVYSSPNSPGVDFHIANFILILLGVVLALSMLVTFYRLLMGAGWRQVLVSLGKTLLGIVGAFLLLVLIILVLPTFPIEMDQPSPLPTPQSVATAPLGAPPASLIWLVGLLIASLAAFLVFTLVTARRHPDQAARLANEIEQARQDLLAGQSLKEVILRCYQQMSRVLQQEGGIERQVFMTPSEFEHTLARAGYPAAPVHQLTHLFEVVRYGGWTPNPWDDQQALESLQAIINHLREKKAFSSDE